jgi:hypothetical protein
VTHCMRHYEEPALDICKNCGRAFCSRCLVFPFGNHKPPYCVGCAITASGVRNRGKVVAQAPKAERMTRAQRTQARADKRAMKKAQRQNQPILEEAPQPPSVDPSVVPGSPAQFGWNRTDAPAASSVPSDWQDHDRWPAGPLVS